MNTKGQEVKRIKEADLKNIRKYLIENNKIDFLAFINIGVNTALRISDLSKIKFENINSDWSFEIIETKTKKKRIVVFNKVCISTIKDLKIYYEKIGYDVKKGYLFKKLSYYNKKFLIDKPVDINSMTRRFAKLKKSLNINYPINSHSLRKTWGYTVYKKTKDIGLVMKALNHSNPIVTLKYIGIEEEDIKEVFKKYEI